MMMTVRNMSTQKRSVRRTKDKKMNHSGSDRSVNQPHWISDDSVSRDKWVVASKDMIHISAKALNIAWGNDHKFWQWVPISKDLSSFEVAAELIQVNWMQVKGTVDLAKCPLSPSTRYKIVYVIKFKVDAFGWQEAPITFHVVTPNGQRVNRSVTLESYRRSSREWHEIPGGGFTTSSEMAGKLEFSMSETRTNWWKGGFILEGVKIKLDSDLSV